MTKKQSLQILKGENYDFQNSNGIENSKKNISDEVCLTDYCQLYPFLIWVNL